MKTVTTAFAALGVTAWMHLLAAPASAGVIHTIDMNAIAGVQHGTVVDVQFPGVTIGATGGGGPAVAAESGNFPRDPDLESPFGAPTGPLTAGLGAGPSNPGFLLIVQENDTGCVGGVCDVVDDDARGGTLVFDFDAPVTLLGLDLFDLDGGSQNEGATITLYSGPRTKTVAGTLVGDGNAVSVDLVTFFDPSSTADVTRMEVAFSSSGATNNIVYQTVPTPATVGLLAFGVMGAAAAARARSAGRRKTAA
jgi:hypothetical protein